MERLATDPLTAGEEPLEGLHRPPAFGERLLAKMDRAAVVGGEQQHPDHLRIMPGQQILERLGAGRLRDLRGRLGRGIVGRC